MKTTLLFILGLFLFQSSTFAQNTFTVCDVKKAKKPLA